MRFLAFLGFPTLSIGLKPPPKSARVFDPPPAFRGYPTPQGVPRVSPSKPYRRNRFTVRIYPQVS